MRLTRKIFAATIGSALLLGAAASKMLPDSLPHHPDSLAAFAFAPGSDPMLLKVADTGYSTSRQAGSLPGRPGFGDVVESSIASVVQVRVQKNPGAEDPSDQEDDSSLLDFLKKYGTPGPQGPTPNTPDATPFGLPKPPHETVPGFPSIPPLDDDPLGLSSKKPKSKSAPNPGPSIPYPKAPARPPLSGGVGSGFFIDATGYLLTNAHVVEGAQKITLRLSDHREIEARLIGIDKRTDIALLKAEGGKFKPLAIGSPDKSRVGDWVLAIGSPFGLEFTATAGILSAKGRALPSDDNYIPFLQTDAAVNPGNSGGPLINERGQAIGINSQIYSKSGGYMGISFAIPIDYAIKIASKMRKGDGTVVHGRIGATVQDMTSELADAFGLSGKTGAIILAVEPGSASDKAGLKNSDIVISVEGKPIAGSNEMVRLIADSDPGDKLMLGIVRKGKPLSIPVTLGGPKALEADPAKATAEPSTKPTPTPSSAREPLGIKGRSITEKEAKALGIDRGLLVLEATGASEEAGIEADDVVLSANNQPIGSSADLAKMAAAAPVGKPIALMVKRGSSLRFVPIVPKSSDRS